MPASSSERIVAICQPHFIPWMGYFEMAERADVFVMLDDVAYSKNGWINRNRLRSPDPRGWQWATVPVHDSGGGLIRDTRIAEAGRWRSKLLASLRQNYGRTPHFARYYPALERRVEAAGDNLAELNMDLLELLCDQLGIAARLVRSSHYMAPGSKDDKLVTLCQHLGATLYLANNGSAPYIRAEKFLDRGIGFVFQDYQHPVYPQGDTKGGFVSHLSVVDCLFWHGPAARDVVLSGRRSDWRSGITCPRGGGHAEPL
ncbi:MAG: WbqC family protein [Magnetospirillum sp.]